MDEYLRNFIWNTTEDELLEFPLDFLNIQNPNIISAFVRVLMESLDIEPPKFLVVPPKEYPPTVIRNAIRLISQSLR